ncbi:MAG: DEAD/DEAH box helicase [Angelakisella sp.]
MNELSFNDLGLTPKVKHAIDDMGFEMATGIQSQSIPLIRTGVDVIGRSQTGTGKTVAFAIPAIERIDTHEERPTVQVLILCPTRELAQQGCDEIKKLTKYKTGVKVADVYGGAPMERQIFALKKANMVIGTPGRIMDHLRRKTLRLGNLKLVVLDEADEMLSMGFKEDIETILTDAPADRQTILFSATMPPAILALTKQFLHDPQMVEINRQMVTIENISQSFVDAPMGRKMDVLNLLLRFHQPQLALIFCNTKVMVDELTEYLNKNGFEAEGLHGDMKQSQRSKVMDGFKFGKTGILVATDVAARGIDVNGIDFVINYDIPQSTEYYVHRIGRTGRAGKSGAAITICSGRRQVILMRSTAREVKSEITQVAIPTPQEIAGKSQLRNRQLVEQAMAVEPAAVYTQLVEQLVADGHDPSAIAAAMVALHFGSKEPEIAEVHSAPMRSREEFDGGFQKIVLSIGRSSHVAPNHIVGAITERAGIRGSEVGKIEIFDDNTTVGIPVGKVTDVIEAMQGCKICGKPTDVALLAPKPATRSGAPYGKRSYQGKSYGQEKPGNFHRRSKSAY